MADRFDPRTRSALMAGIPNRDTKPERIVRTLLFLSGYRFRKHLGGLPGRPDVAFTRRRAAIFVHGCFWHGHDCRKGRRPTTRPEFWTTKLLKNRSRDQQQQRDLVAMGWRVLIIWECETLDIPALLSKSRMFLGAPRSFRQTHQPTS
jgi:DNA mismatch endonuclease (patch repair protein)